MELTLGESTQRLGYLMAAGYPEDAARLAVELATWVMDNLMLRRVCPFTGCQYFSPDEDEY